MTAAALLAKAYPVLSDLWDCTCEDDWETNPCERCATLQEIRDVLGLEPRKKRS